MNARPLCGVVATQLLALVLSMNVFGQATSQIQGTIVDSAERGISSAEVTATHADTGFERRTTSGPEGGYVLSSLPLGQYSITVEKSGFKTVVRKGIELQITSNATADITLQVSSISETIEVVADAPLVETRTMSIGTVLENKRILEMPLNGRNLPELIQFAGAAVPGGKNTTSGFPNGLNFSIAGGQLSGVSYQLDGSMYNNLFDAAHLPFPFPDALQEFKVETGTLSAQSGTHASGWVSASMKSGTNQLHGNLFEFLRNGSMNAKKYLANRRDTLKRNQFGGTFGGPVVKNKLFFAGYQGTRTRSDPDDLPGYVPTKQMLAGDFSGCSSVPDNLLNPGSNGASFAGKQIPVTRFSPQALQVVRLLPESTDPCGKVSYGAITNSNEHQVLGRVDYAVSAKHQIFGRYIATTFAQPAPFALSGNILDTNFAGIDDLAQSAALGHTFLVSPNVVNQFRFAGNRVAVQRFNHDYFSGCSIGVNMYCYFDKQTIVNVGGGSANGGFNIGAPPATPGTFFPTYLTLSNDVTVVRGSHTVNFGYSSFKYQQSQEVNISSVANFAFPGSATGYGLADFLLGRVGMFTQSAPTGVYTNKWGHSLYFHDTWKVSRRLTLNYGLRWEPFLPQSLNDGAVYNFSLDAFEAGVRSQVYKNAPPGLSYPGDPGFQGKAGVNKRWNQFAPRVGIAWDPRGNGMTSVRAAAGVAYDFPNLQIMSNPTAAPPFSGRVVRSGVEFANPYGGPFPFPVTTGPDAPFPLSGSFVAQQPDAKAPTTYSWNLSLQHQLGRDWFVSASYIGSQSIHLWVSRPLNPAILIPGPIVASCPTAQSSNCNAANNINVRRIAYLANGAADAGGKLGPVDMLESGGGSNYNGLLLSTQKRFSRGISLNANYTWSHCIGDMTIASGPGGPTTGGGTYTDVNDRRRDRGNCSTTTVEGIQSLDRRHIFNFTTVLESPRFQNPVLERAVSHWKLSGNYRFLSSSYLTVTNGPAVDRALTGSAVADQRANQVLTDVLCKTRNVNCWIDPNAFTMPALGSLGNAGRSNVAGPGFFGLDLAVARVFRVRDFMSLEVRGEAFNATNSVRLNAPVTARNSSTFGKILSAQEPRIMQVALKLVF